MKKIYFVLIKAHTGLGKIARAVTKYDYTHIAICTDKSLTDFITFSRRRHYLPLDAGFMHEHRDYYAFGRHNSVKVKVFEVPTYDHSYNEIVKFIAQCEKDDQLIFNLFSMATMPIFHGFEIHKAYNCMSFTAKIAELSGAVKLDRPYYKFSIQDLDKLLSRYKFFEGRLKRIPSQGYEKYMEKPTFSQLIATSVHTFFTLFVRMLSKGGIED